MRHPSKTQISPSIGRGPVAIWLPLVLFLTMALALVVMACGPRPSTGTEEPATSPTPAAEEESPGATVEPAEEGNVSLRAREKGVLRRLFSDPPTLDPHLTTDATSASIIVEVFGGLVTISPSLDVVPDLAEDWSVSDDGLVYTFFLRKEAVFHNGKPITAEDFKWSLERAADAITESLVVDQYLGDIVGLKEKLRGEAREVQGIRVIDDHTLEITINEPKSYFLSKLTYPTAFVLDRENVESGRRWVREPNGSGPFKLEEYVPGELLVLAKNPNYHLGPAYLERVELVLSGGTSMLMYENDEIDVTGVGIADLDRLLDVNNSLNAELQQALPSFSTSYIGMNTTVPPFDDVKVRQALNYAVNREEIANLVLANMVTPAKGILPPGFPAFNPELEGYNYDPEKAQQLLSESKYADNLSDYPIILTVSGGFGASVDLDLESITYSWQEVLGVEVEFQQTEFATYLQDLHKRRFDMFQIAWIADYPDPENFLDILFHSESSNNHTQYSNPEVDRLLVQARTERDQATRYQLYKQAEEIIVDEAPWIPLWHSGEQYVLIKPWVKDYHLTQLIVPRLRFVRITE